MHSEPVNPPLLSRQDRLHQDCALLDTLASSYEPFTPSSIVPLFDASPLSSQPHASAPTENASLDDRVAHLESKSQSYNDQRTARLGGDSILRLDSKELEMLLQVCDSLKGLISTVNARLELNRGPPVTEVLDMDMDHVVKECYYWHQELNKALQITTQDQLAMQTLAESNRKLQNSELTDSLQNDLVHLESCMQTLHLMTPVLSNTTEHSNLL